MTTTLEIVETMRLLTFSFTLFDLSIISAPTPISAALRKIRGCEIGCLSFEGFVAVALITSIFCVLLPMKCLQHSKSPVGRFSDLANTFLVPDEIKPSTALGFICLNVGGSGKALAVIGVTSALLLLLLLLLLSLSLLS